MKSHYHPFSETADERLERETGFPRPLDMDPDRHGVVREPCSIWVKAWQTTQGGRFAWKIRCGCGRPFSGSSEGSVKRKLREHLEGKR